MAKIYEINDIVPVIDPSSFVHPDAILIGDAIVGPNCYVGPGAVMRGDFGRLILETGVNIQDNCILHGFPGTDTVVEEDGHIGHGAVLHGCRIGPNALVGMNSVINDDAVIGAECIVAAMAFVRAGEEFAPRSLIAGIPAKILRQVSDDEIEWKSSGTRDYQTLTKRSLETLKSATALSAPEADRPRMPVASSQPFHVGRR
jgi:phenylacetic acid degradation protein